MTPDFSPAFGLPGKVLKLVFALCLQAGVSGRMSVVVEMVIIHQNVFMNVPYLS